MGGLAGSARRGFGIGTPSPVRPRAMERNDWPAATVKMRRTIAASGSQITRPVFSGLPRSSVSSVCR